MVQPRSLAWRDPGGKAKKVRGLFNFAEGAERRQRADPGQTKERIFEHPGRSERIGARSRVLPGQAPRGYAALGLPAFRPLPLAPGLP